MLKFFFLTCGNQTHRPIDLDLVDDEISFPGPHLLCPVPSINDGYLYNTKLYFNNGCKVIYCLVEFNDEMFKY